MKLRADFFASMRSQFLASKKLKGRLLRYWGTEVVDGVEVFNKKFVVYPNPTTRRVRKITNMLGISKDIESASYDGLDEFYLKFNPRKSKKTSDYTRDIIAAKVNSFATLGEVFTLTLNIHDPADPSKYDGLTNAEILSLVDSQYSTLLDSNYIESRGDAILDDAIGPYLLLDDDTHFEVSIVKAAIGAVPHTYQQWLRTITTYTTSLTLEIQYKRISTVLDTSVLVDKIVEEKEAYRQKQLQLLLEASLNEDGESQLSDSPIPVTDALFYKDQLRVELLDTAVLNRDAFAELINSTIDTGYIKKKTKWWKKVLSFVMFVVAIYFVAVTGGSSLAAFAGAMSTATLALVAIQLAIAKSGDEAFAQQMGPYIQAGSLLSTVAGIGSMISNMATTIARQGLVSAVTQTVSGLFTETVKSSASSVTAQAATQATTQAVNQATTVSITKIVSMAFKVTVKFIGWREEKKAKSLESQISEASREKEELEEDLYDMQDKSLHMGIEDIKWYTTPLTVENSQYRIDYLYEGTKYNICRPSFYKATGLNIIDK